MSNKTKEPSLKTTARRLLASVYHHPEHLPLVQAEQPVMPSAGLDHLWTAMQTAYSGGDLDPTRLEHLLAENGQYEKTGVHAREELQQIRAGSVLSDLEAARMGVETTNIERWARRLREAATKRALGTKLKTLGARCMDSDASADEVAAGVISAVQDVMDGASGSSMRHISEYVDAAVADLEEWAEGEDADFLPTGFYSMDRAIGGLPVGELTIFAAPSGAGKTSFLLQLLRQVALIEQGKGAKRAVCLFSIEMTGKQCIHRAAAAWKGLNMRAMRSRHSESDNLDTHREALRALADLPIYIDPDPEPTLDQMRSRVLQVSARHEVALVGVDYDEKVGVEDQRSEELRVSRISRGMKNVAKETGSAVVALSQYNSRPADDQRPGTDDDLRYSRKKKHEAHTILHWHWPRYWIEKGDATEERPPQGYDPSKPNRGVLRCTKNRSGPLGQVELDFHPKYTRFVDPNAPGEGG